MCNVHRQSLTPLWKLEPVQMFNPALPMLVLGNRPDVAPDMRPAMDAVERFFVCLWLHRYATWCAKSRRWLQADAAGTMWRRMKHCDAK